MSDRSRDESGGPSVGEQPGAWAGDTLPGFDLAPAPPDDRVSPHLPYGAGEADADQLAADGDPDAADQEPYAAAADPIAADEEPFAVAQEPYVADREPEPSDAPTSAAPELPVEPEPTPNPAETGTAAAPVMPPEPAEPVHERPPVPPPGPQDPAAFLAAAHRPGTDAIVRFRLHAADRALVAEGDSVMPGMPLYERCRETHVAEVAHRGEIAGLRPGDEADPAWVPASGFLGRHVAEPDDLVRVLSLTPDGRAQLAIGRAPEVVASPVAGTVVEVGAGHIAVEAYGLVLRGRVGWGRPVVGRLVVAVSGPEAELRSPAIDIGMAGSILLAGARIDIEALTRARAIGVAGIIAGGIVGREAGQLAEADVRQRAALHAANPFGIVALEGYGRRVISSPDWELLVSAAGAVVGLVPAQELVVVDPAAGIGLPPPPGRSAVIVTAGDRAGGVATIAGLVGPYRHDGGVYHPSGAIEEADRDGVRRRRIVPLSDLERLG